MLELWTVGRIISEEPDVATAERKVQDTQLAANVLTQLEKQLGVNPLTSVEETHALSDFLRKEMEKYDTEIAKDIGLTERAQRRNKIINDDGTQHVDDMQAVRRKLEEDKAKEQEIRTELKELKNIELMTTGLELAKYLALEKSKHDLQIAQAVTRSRASADHDANIAQQALSQSGPFTGWQPVYQQPPYASFSGYPTSNKYPSEPSIYAPPQNALQTSSVAQQIPLNAELPAQHIPEAASVRQQPAAYTNSPAVESQFKPAQMPDIPNAALQPPSSSFQARPQYIPEVASAVQQSSSIVNKATAESQFSSNQIPGTSSAAQQTPSTNTELYPQYMAEVASFGQQPVSYVYNTAAESQFRPNKISETAAQSRHITKTVAIQRAPGPSRISRPFYNKNILSKRPKPWHKPIRLISNPSAKVKNQYGNANYLEGFPSKLTFPGPTYSPPPITVKVVKPTYIPVKTYAQYPTSYQSQTNLNIPQSFLNQGLVSFFSSQKQLQPYESWYKMSEMNTGKTYPSYQTQYLMLPFSQAAPQPTTIASLNAAPSSTFVEQHVNGYSPSASYLTNVPSSPVSQATKSGSSKHEIHSVKAIPPASTINEHEPSAIPDENAKATTYSNHPPSISTELPAASKAAVPSYTTYNNNKPLSAAQQPLPALIPKPITQYYGGPYQLHPVSSHEILDTDDSNFHGSSYNNNNNNNNNFNNGQQSAEQQHASNGGQQPASNGEQQTAPNGEQVPLAFGLFPLPEGKGQDMQSANESKGDKEVAAAQKQYEESEQRLHNTQKAAEAVTHIENKIGFDPGSIAKLVDFVKTAAEKDLELSKKAVSRDESAIKKMEIAGTTRQREMGTNVALNDAKDKLKTDQDILKETKDRLEKIKQMELIVTEIEAAKFSALNRAGHNQYEKKIEWNSAARRRSFKTSP